MSYDEYLHWAAFFRSEPFGEWRADLRSADLLAMLANINRDPKKQGALTHKDFMRDWWQDQRQEDEKPDGKALLEKFRMLTMPREGG